MTSLVQVAALGHALPRMLSRAFAQERVRTRSGHHSLRQDVQGITVLCTPLSGGPLAFVAVPDPLVILRLHMMYSPMKPLATIVALPAVQSLLRIVYPPSCPRCRFRRTTERIESFLNSHDVMETIQAVPGSATSARVHALVEATSLGNALDTRGVVSYH